MSVLSENILDWPGQGLLQRRRPRPKTPPPRPPFPLLKTADLEREEAALVERARGGDLAAFSSLVVNYQERAVRVAYSLVGNFEDARDLAQEAFVKAFDRIGSFQAESRFYTWFYRLLTNHCKDFLRRKKLRAAVFFWREGGSAGDETDPIDRAPAHGKDAGEALLDKELGQEILRSLESLPLRQRSAFSLRYLEGLSLEEIAESMGLSVGAVKAHLWQAAQKMRTCLQDYAGIREEPDEA